MDFEFFFHFFSTLLFLRLSGPLSEYAGIEPRTVATLLPDALRIRPDLKSHSIIIFSFFQDVIDVVSVLTRLMESCSQYVTAKQSNLSHWHPVLGRATLNTSLPSPTSAIGNQF